MKSKEYIQMGYVDIKEIYKFLDENAHNVKNVLKSKIKSEFHLTDKQTDSVYSKWKTEYMKYKAC